MNVLKVFLVTVATLTLTFVAQASESEGPVDLTLPVLGGGEQSLSDLRGQWVVVNFWATWCAPCRKEIPDLSNLHDSRDDITVLGLAYEEIEEAALFEFLEEYQATYPILLVDVYSPPEAFGVPRVMPTTHLLNPQGLLVESWVGPVTGEQIAGAVDGHEGKG